MVLWPISGNSALLIAMVWISPAPPVYYSHHQPGMLAPRATAACLCGCVRSMPRCVSSTTLTQTSALYEIPFKVASVCQLGEHCPTPGLKLQSTCSCGPVGTQQYGLPGWLRWTGPRSVVGAQQNRLPGLLHSTCPRDLVGTQQHRLPGLRRGTCFGGSDGVPLHGTPPLVYVCVCVCVCVCVGMGVDVGLGWR
jgi:hypothetical protein